MSAKLCFAALLVPMIFAGPCYADDPAAPVREVLRLEMWSIAAAAPGGDGPFTQEALAAHFTKSFAALYAAARAKVDGAKPPFDRDPILDGTAQCPINNIVLTVLSPGAFHARVKAEFQTAWCIDPGQEPSRRERITTTTFEMANEDDEWRIDDIRRDDWAFRDVLAAAAPNAGQEPPPAAPPVDPKTCVKDDSGFKQRGNAATYEITLTNTCAVRLRCTVNAYVTTARGPTSGTGTLILERKSKGAAASKTYALKIKSAGGMATVSRECKAM